MHAATFKRIRADLHLIKRALYFHIAMRSTIQNISDNVFWFFNGIDRFNQKGYVTRTQVLKSVRELGNGGARGRSDRGEGADAYRE